MQIKEMFARDIGREINNVITVGKNESANFEQQELEEYVVTRELQHHFADFFAAYKKGIVGETAKMGVWISGFFGSGKSHFLKMLSFLLSNHQVKGKTAWQYFEQGHKIQNPEVVANIKLAAETPTDAILFNIDAKNSANSKQDKDAIVKVFAKVFDEMQGYYGEIPQLAELERGLDKRGIYEDFQQRFQEKTGSTWLSLRHDLYFNQDIIIAVLTEMGVMSEEAARNWCESATNSDSDTISVETFAKRVQDYIESKGENHHVVFLVDEVGQYIGEDTKLMLNLQTVVEELGKACHGKAWVVVTAQQEIDTYTRVKDNDFSKIQGRFDTRLALSSANVDEVIKERILKKTPVATDTLELAYDDLETTIKNLLMFTGTAEKKLYHNRADYAAIYPFVGYQFDLLGKVLTKIRENGASGKSLSEGERSMLSFFKEVANSYKEHDDNTLIPFNAFYLALSNYLDHSHSSVIIKAYNNSHINPEAKPETEQVFAIEVLKTLFMIKYVPEIEANIENITSLMVDNVREERSILRQKVKQALKVLLGEMLIQQQGNVYIFLTNEEQEVNRRIEHQEVEEQEILTRLGEMIFDDLLTEKRYRYPAFGNRYAFGFNQWIDDSAYHSNVNNELNLRVITPLADYDGKEATMLSLSMQARGIVVALPQHDDYIREIRTTLKIENFIKKDQEVKALAQYEMIRVRKAAELKERLQLARTSLSEALSEAAIYVNGHRAEIKTKEFNKRLSEAFQNLIMQVFNKLNYINKPMDEAATLQMLASHEELMTGGGEANANALRDMQSYISMKTSNRSKISLKDVKEHFEHAPYGFVDDDVFYLVARLYKRGDIALALQGENLTLNQHEPKEILNYIRKKAYAEKLMLSQRIKVSEKEKRIARELMRDLFGKSMPANDEDALMLHFQELMKGQQVEMQGLLGQAKTGHYPGQEVLEQGLHLFQHLCQLQNNHEFFRAVAQSEDRLLDFAEDYEKVHKFFNGPQKEFFDAASKTYKIYRESHNYLTDDKLDKIAKQLQEILQSPRPYRRIHELPQLRAQFNDSYEEILQEKAKPVKEHIQLCQQRIVDALSGKPYEQEAKEKFYAEFSKLIQEADQSNNINRLMSLTNQAEALKERFLQQIAEKDTELANKVAESKQKATLQGKTMQKVAYQPKKTKYIAMREVAGCLSVEVKNEAEIDELLVKFKKQLQKELCGLDSIHIEF